MASSLDDYLRSFADGAPPRRDVAETVRRLALAAVKLGERIATGSAEDAGAASGGGTNAGGDFQKQLDIVADRVFTEAARAAPLAFYGSEEQDGAVALNQEAGLALAIDPLDGSSNIETNMSIGTIFSILPVTDAHRAAPDTVFQQPGTEQLGGGFFIYGPQLLLVLSLGEGTRVYAHAPAKAGFFLLRDALAIAEAHREFAVNVSNHRHWAPEMRGYVDDCLAGASGPRGGDYNMRWTGSMVADAYRILLRGGVFLYPGDARKGYGEGRLRLVYEANPVALCVEQAGGAATNGKERILDIVPAGLHARTPLVFGSAGEVAEVAKCLATRRV